MKYPRGYKEHRICAYCGKEFVATIGNKKIQNKSKVCSINCHNKSRANEVPSIDLLKKLLAKIDSDTVDIRTFAKTTKYSLRQVRSSIWSEYKDYYAFHEDIKGTYTPKDGVRGTKEHKIKCSRDKVCAYCGVKYVGHFNARYCSNTCKDRAKTEKPIGGVEKCYVCDKDVTLLYKHRTTKVITCNPKCYSIVSARGVTAQILFDELDALGFNGVREYTFNDLRNDATGALLKIDYYSKDYNLAVEYHGEQHYADRGFFGDADPLRLEKQQYRDSVKREYLKNKQIQYIEWPYTLKVNEKNIKKILSEIELGNTEMTTGFKNPVIS